MKLFLYLFATTTLIPTLSALAQDSSRAHTNQDSLLLVQAGDTVSSGLKTFKYPNGKVSAMGNLFHWNRDGWWSIYQEDGAKVSEVYFEAGKGLHMKTFDAHGNLTSVTDSVEKEAAFPGGDQGWSDYVRNSLMAKIDFITRRNAWGRIEVQFIVGRDGVVSDVALVKSTGTVSDNVVMDIFRKSPRWIPAQQYNRKVKAYRRQKLTLEPPK